MVDNRSDNVWTVEAAAAAAEVVFEVVVELEGLSILQGEDAVHAPSVLQFLQIATHSGQLIGEIPGEAIRDGSDSMPPGNTEARLQCVVIRLAGGVFL